MMNEKISALVDAELDELDERRVLEAMKNDAELCRAWERYYLIRAAMTRQLDVLAPAGMRERIWAELEQDVKVKPASLRFWPLAGGFAVAASVAVAAIVGLQTLRTPTMPIKVAATTVATPAATAVGANAPVVEASTNASATTPLPNPGERLNLYLVGHSEFMPLGGTGNMLPYVRVVADSPDQ